MITRDYVFLSLAWGGLGGSVCTGIGVSIAFFKAPDELSAAFYVYVGILIVVNACLGVIAYREWRYRQFGPWVGMNSPRWTPLTWQNPPGAFALGFRSTQVDPVNDGPWQAELYGLAEVLPGRPEIGSVMASGHCQGEAIANLWKALHALHTGDCKPPPGTLWGSQ